MFLAIKDALREDDTVDIEKMDRVSLYKARECFLILLDKADELYLATTMKREDGVIYNTFYFEQDNYRILTLYPILMKNLPDDDAKMRRDFEMKYARTVCQSGSINLTQFRVLTAKDKTLLFVLAEEINMLHIILQFYKRNNMLDKADEMFEKLFTEHKEYVESEPEYIYRAYILYILDYQRDLKKALQFYTMNKDEMKDGDIREFWESELMMCTNSFNNPKQFEEERKLLVEQGLMPEEEFYWLHTCVILTVRMPGSISVKKIRCLEGLERKEKTFRL